VTSGGDRVEDLTHAEVRKHIADLESRGWSIPKDAVSLAADAAVSYGDAHAALEAGDYDESRRSVDDVWTRVRACHEAAAGEGTPAARDALAKAVGLLLTLPRLP